MYHPILSQPRETNTVRCCGILYKRWRIIGRPWGLHHEECCRCLKPLEWRKHTKKEPIERKPLNEPAKARRRVQCRYAQRDHRARIIPERVAAGLTTRGTERKYTLHDLGRLHGNDRKLARQRIYRAKPLPAREQAWREFRATIETRKEAA